MNDPIEDKLKTEIDNIVIRINKILKKIEADESEETSHSKQNKP